jgi:uncharacterized membrane protein
MTDQRVEEIIGNLLRAGVVLAALTVVAGGIVYLDRHAYYPAEHRQFEGEPQTWSTLGGLFTIDTLRHGRGIIMLGLVVLLLTPVARVAFALVAFALEHDWLYVGFTAIVLGLLIYSLHSA